MTDTIYNNTLLTGLAERHPMPLNQVKAAVKEVFFIVKDGLLRDGSVRIQNFGTFRLKRIAEHRGRNPQTGEAITIKAQNRVVFRPAKALRELIEPNKAKATPVVEEKAIEKKVIEYNFLENKTDRQAAPIVEPSTPEITTISRPEIIRKIKKTSQLNAEQGNANEADNQNTRSRKKVYAWGAAAALVVVVLLALLQNDREIKNQSVVATQVVAPQAITPIKIQNTPATSVAPVILAEQNIAITETDKQHTVIDTSPTADTSATPPLVQPDEQHKAPFFAERKHEIMRGDSLWRLAKNNYDEPLLWTHIYQANRSSIKNPDLLRIKGELTLPTLEGKVGELTEQDRYHIAEGYYLAYLYYQSTDNMDSFFALLEAKRYSAKLVEEKMSSLNLTRLEKLLLKHQPTL